jgi:Polyketide cyclase / dehydrase and lipid transport
MSKNQHSGEMSKNQHSVVTAAPVERVFAFAADLENDPRWRTEVQRMRYTSGRPAAGRFIVVRSPAVMEAIIHEIGQRIHDPHNPSEQDGPPSEEQMSRMMEAMGKHIEMLPPDRMPNA